MFTSHGHQIKNTPAEEMPDGFRVARCGGPGLCGQCSVEATQAQKDANVVVNGDGQHKPSDIMQYFSYKHLPPMLAGVSLKFHGLAMWVDETLPNGPEKSVALRKLLEGKDAAVRAALPLVE